MKPDHSPAFLVLSRRTRMVLAAWAAVCVCGFVLAFLLSPDQRGFGTHEKLGLPPCLVPEILNKPCPACGMTTSITHLVRGELMSALRANVAGVYLAFVCLMHIPIATHLAWTGIIPSHSHLITNLVLSVALTAPIATLQWIFQLLA